MQVHPSRESVRQAFESVRANPGFAESCRLVEAGGLPVEMLQAMSLRPELLAAFGAFSASVYPGGVVERSVKEAIILEISRRNRCQFCTQSHVEIARALGLSEDPLAWIDDLERLSAREALAVEYARCAWSDSNAIPQGLRSRLAAAFTEPELVEVTAMIGLITMLNLFNNCLEVRYRGEYGAAEAPPRTGGG